MTFLNIFGGLMPAASYALIRSPGNIQVYGISRYIFMCSKFKIKLFHDIIITVMTMMRLKCSQ